MTIDLCFRVEFAIAALMSSISLVASGAGAASPSTTAKSAFVDVFNGKDLSGWIVEGTTVYDDHGVEKPVWSVREGIIQCAGEGFGFLRYDEPLDDFELRLEFKLTPGCNSGVGIRHDKYTGETRTRPSRSGYEIQLLDNDSKKPTKKSTGSLYRYVAPRSIPMKHVGQWNELQVKCVGQRIQVSLNGKTIQDVDQSEIAEIAMKPLKGYVSLQNHGGRIAFRAIQMKKLHLDN